MTNELIQLQKENTALRERLQQAQQAAGAHYYFSEAAQHDWFTLERFPENGLDRETVKLIIQNAHALDFDQRLNTSSYVNVSLDAEEEAVALMGLQVNLADQTVYTQSYKLHDTVVNMLADLWHCPRPDDFDEYKVYPGAGTVGSTEACLLAGLAFKFRWRNWYAKRAGLSVGEVIGARPNLVISTCFQAVWEKLFKYMDIEPRFIQGSGRTFTLNLEKVREAIDEHTMGVVCIMGNHYGGQYDPVWDVNEVVEQVNAEKGYQVGIHVDAASGAFIAPFQDSLPAWDFRLKNVLSISASGHKYGEACCGAGWVIWRQREDLSEHVAISVTYLGGKADSYTLNFSRPATGVYSQYYKLLHYGRAGYRQCCENMLRNTKFLRDGLKAMTCKNGKPRFVLLDGGDDRCLPVVAARLNPESGFNYDDVDLQNAVSQHHWYVGSYRMEFSHPVTGEKLALFHDEDREQTMFRMVVKSNLTRSMVKSLLESIQAALDFLDSIDSSELRGFETHNLRHKDQRRFSNHC